MYFYGDIEPSKRLALTSSTGLGRQQRQLGLQEGEARLTCPPGQVKAYLPEWPYQKCVPAEEMLEPKPGAVAIAPPREPAPPPAPPVPAAPPALAPPPEAELPPGTARLLDIDPVTGDIIDPSTGAPLESESAMVLSETAQPIVGTVLGLGAVALVLWAIGAFR